MKITSTILIALLVLSASAMRLRAKNSTVIVGNSTSITVGGATLGATFGPGSGESEQKLINTETSITKAVTTNAGTKTTGSTSNNVEYQSETSGSAKNSLTLASSAVAPNGEASIQGSTTDAQFNTGKNSALTVGSTAVTNTNTNSATHSANSNALVGNVVVGTGNNNGAISTTAIGETTGSGLATDAAASNTAQVASSGQKSLVVTGGIAAGNGAVVNGKTSSSAGQVSGTLAKTGNGGKVATNLETIAAGTATNANTGANAASQDVSIQSNTLKPDGEVASGTLSQAESKANNAQSNSLTGLAKSKNASSGVLTQATSTSQKSGSSPTLTSQNSQLVEGLANKGSLSINQNSVSGGTAAKSSVVSAQTPTPGSSKNAAAIGSAVAGR
jgi:hypothetical protein